MKGKHKINDASGSILHLLDIKDIFRKKSHGISVQPFLSAIWGNCTNCLVDGHCLGCMIPKA